MVQKLSGLKSVFSSIDEIDALKKQGIFSIYLLGAMENPPTTKVQFNRWA